MSKEGVDRTIRLAKVGFTEGLKPSQGCFLGWDSGSAGVLGAALSTFASKPITVVDTAAIFGMTIGEADALMSSFMIYDGKEFKDRCKRDECRYAHQQGWELAGEFFGKGEQYDSGRHDPATQQVPAGDESNDH
jgi:hypothetical protein